MTVRGQGTRKNVQAGLAAIGELAANGQASAFVLLGDLHSRGEAGRIDGAVAVAAYKEAAARGRAEAFIRLGHLYRDGVVVPASERRAVGYYQQAAALGDSFALYVLGRAHVDGVFQRIGSPRMGFEILQRAEREGVPEAVVALSSSYLLGRGVQQNRRRALSTLEEAMDNGNIAAARYLIAIYRDRQPDGRPPAVRRNLLMAKRYFDGIKSRLPASVLAYENLMFEASSLSRREHSRLYDRLQEMAPDDRLSFIRQIRNIDPSLYVSLVQTKLSDLQLFRGRRGGSPTSATIQAMMRYCNQKGVPQACRGGPLDARTRLPE
jgi:TPR repeat protein